MQPGGVCRVRRLNITQWRGAVEDLLRCVCHQSGLASWQPCLRRLTRLPDIDGPALLCPTLGLNRRMVTLPWKTFRDCRDLPLHLAGRTSHPLLFTRHRSHCVCCKNVKMYCVGAGGEASETPPMCAVCLDEFSDGSEVGHTPIRTASGLYLTHLDLVSLRHESL